jgi:hypothetical protein
MVLYYQVSYIRSGEWLLYEFNKYFGFLLIIFLNHNIARKN